ncbi:hypothetical protein [Salibacterium halotolerans]|uniref:hypothetical protein n=1 Tax=Salibacterium halotolerans TaxID=1884432 RepID=UPI001BB0923E|nr:hypothetical protein [Salibacterium halotolerans]
MRNRVLRPGVVFGCRVPPMHEDSQFVEKTDEKGEQPGNGSSDLPKPAFFWVICNLDACDDD